MTTSVYTHDDCFAHEPGEHHPESPQRLRAVLDALRTPDFAAVHWREAPLGSVKQVLLVHDEAYVENVPLPRSSGSALFRERMGAVLLPALRRFAPELLIISAGFDAHELDPLGGLAFTDDDYTWITRELMAAADASAQGRVVSVLEGGYSLQALASASAAHVRALMLG